MWALTCRAVRVSWPSVGSSGACRQGRRAAASPTHPRKAQGCASAALGTAHSEPASCGQTFADGREAFRLKVLGLVVLSPPGARYLPAALADTFRPLGPQQRPLLSGQAVPSPRSSCWRRAGRQAGKMQERVGQQTGCLGTRLVHQRLPRAHGSREGCPSALFPTWPLSLPSSARCGHEELHVERVCVWGRCTGCPPWAGLCLCLRDRAGCPGVRMHQRTGHVGVGSTDSPQDTGPPAAHQGDPCRCGGSPSLRAQNSQEGLPGGLSCFP